MHMMNEKSYEVGFLGDNQKGGLGVLGFLTLGLKLGCYMNPMDPNSPPITMVTRFVFYFLRYVFLLS
jgi:hypothetical protein